MYVRHFQLLVYTCIHKYFETANICMPAYKVYPCKTNKQSTLSNFKRQLCQPTDKLKCRSTQPLYACLYVSLRTSELVNFWISVLKLISEIPFVARFRFKLRAKLWQNGWQHNSTICNRSGAIKNFIFTHTFFITFFEWVLSVFHNALRSVASN